MLLEIANKFENNETPTVSTIEPSKCAQKIIDSNEIVSSQIYSSADKDEVKLG